MQIPCSNIPNTYNRTNETVALGETGRNLLLGVTKAIFCFSSKIKKNIFYFPDVVQSTGADYTVCKACSW